ncbi:MAG: mechanosensitive ion channel domain-containing protein [Ferruginibacter sp.]
MNFLDDIFLDNSIRSYLLAAGIILVAFLAKKFLSQRLASFIYSLFQKNWSALNKADFTKFTVKPTSWFLFAVISIFTLDKLNFPSAWNVKIYGHELAHIIDRLGVILLVVFFTWLVTSLIDFISLLLEEKAKLTKDKSDDQLIVFFRDFLKVLAGIAGFLLLLKLGFHQNIGNLLTGLSIVGAALALAAKESLENLISSFIIFTDKPFYTGDTVKLNNITGKIEKIGLRSTRIRTTDKTLVTVPNRQMVSGIVDNWSMRTQRRAEMKFEFSQKTGTGNTKKFIEETKSILAKYPEKLISSSVFLTDYNKNSVTVSIEYFTIPFTMDDYNKLKEEINFSLMKLVDHLQIEMASSNSSITIFSNEGDAGAPKESTVV